jgi:hypothetical protein
MMLSSADYIVQVQQSDELVEGTLRAVSAVPTWHSGTFL